MATPIPDRLNCKHRMPLPSIGDGDNAWRRAKPYLAEDFEGFCAYCGVHEAHLEVFGYFFFSVDHFRPKSKPEFNHLRNVYTNLYYACVRCNSFKGNNWPTNSELELGAGFINPCIDRLYGRHLRLEVDGRLTALTRPGEYTCDKVGLNREDLVRYRLDRRQRESAYKERLRSMRQSLEALQAALQDPKLSRSLRLEILEACEKVSSESSFLISQLEHLTHPERSRFRNERLGQPRTEDREFDGNSEAS